MSNLYTSDTFINKNIIYLFNTIIYEYDIKSAGINLAKFYNLLPAETIEKLLALPKQKRVVAEGVLKRENKEYNEASKKAFQDIRKLFLDTNALEESDIVSIKKDAFFVTKKLDALKFKNVVFVEKNKYTSYIRLGHNEFYYSPEKLDIKGLNDSLIELHKEGIIQLIITFFDTMETKDKRSQLTFMRKIMTDYKFLNLPIDFYREFNMTSKFNCKEDGLTYEEYWDDKKEDLDIMYNLQNIIIPLSKIAL